MKVAIYVMGSADRMLAEVLSEAERIVGVVLLGGCIICSTLFGYLFVRLIHSDRPHHARKGKIAAIIITSQTLLHHPASQLPTTVARRYQTSSVSYASWAYSHIHPHCRSDCHTWQHHGSSYGGRHSKWPSSPSSH